MLIHRRPWSARRSRRRFGAPLTLLTGALAGVLVLVLGWLGGALTPDPQPDLRGLSDAQRAFSGGDLDAAVDAAERVLAAAPGQPDAALMAVRALIYRSYTDWDRASDRRRALDVAQAAVVRAPDSADAQAALAFALHADGQRYAAFTAAERALRLQPTHTMGRVVYGLAYAGLGSFDRALIQLQQAVKSTDYQVDALRALAVVQSDAGRYRDAAVTVDKAIALNWGLIPLHFERALYALQVGDGGAASTAYLRVLALDRENVKARLRLCELHSTLREFDQAIRTCTEVTERAPDWSAGWHRLGREYFLLGDFPSAQDALNRCSTLEAMQGIAPAERTFDCWYLQGQAAALNNDCPALWATYGEFQLMAIGGPLAQTWVYPPEGPPNCPRPTPTPPR